MGRHVCVKVWIHLIAGNTLGHNTLLGHFNGGLPKYIYRDCNSLFEEFSNPIPSCSLITLEEMQQAHMTQDGKSSFGTPPAVVCLLLNNIDPYKMMPAGVDPKHIL